IDDLSAMRQRLLALGATLKTPRTYEDNWLFDTPDEQLTRRGCLLRLRRDRRNLITYKEPPAQQDRDFKVLGEYEIEVSDFAQAHTILEKLGFALHCAMRNIVRPSPTRGQRSSSMKSRSGPLWKSRRRERSSGALRQRSVSISQPAWLPAIEKFLMPCAVATIRHSPTCLVRQFSP